MNYTLEQRLWSVEHCIADAHHYHRNEPRVLADQLARLESKRDEILNLMRMEKTNEQV